jgi:hypothetical protein
MRIAEKVMIPANKSNKLSAAWASMLILPVSQLTTTLSIIKPTTTPISSLVAPALVENIFSLSCVP